ncbi:MAG TPA: site-2 protease family protein [Bacteroidetes bacterium]|nr:site-2 protease family protein [Bacteroidota bacterium]HRR08236.1 site-2 protease family protein [Rhodothermales bacterium]
MSDSSHAQTQPLFDPTAKVEKERYFFHFFWFILTFISVTWAGAEQATGQYPLFTGVRDWTHWIASGLLYAIPFLGFLTTHEFGHYFAARYHKIKTSLPFFIPAPLMLLGLPFSIGTFGAVIRIKQVIPRTRQLFDVGIAGPIAGFVVAFGVLIFALFTLPPPTYIMQLPGHEEVQTFIRQFGRFPTGSEIDLSGAPMMGQTLLYWFLTLFFEHVPPMYEMYHYPILLAGWLGLFFTALNMMPVGQLDGGHVWYALFGPTVHRIVARIFTTLLILSGSIGFALEVIPAIGDGLLSLHAGFRDFPAAIVLIGWMVVLGIQYLLIHKTYNKEMRWVGPVFLLTATLTSLPVALTSADLPAFREIGVAITEWGYTSWLLWSFLIVRFIGVDHPPVQYPEPLTPKRKVLAWLSIMLFFLCFSPTPIYIAP